MDDELKKLVAAADAAMTLANNLNYSIAAMPTTTGSLSRVQLNMNYTSARLASNAADERLKDYLIKEQGK